MLLKRLLRSLAGLSRWQACEAPVPAEPAQSRVRELARQTDLPPRHATGSRRVQASRGQAGHHAQPEAQLRLPATLGRNRPGGGLRADGPLKPDGHALDLRPLDQERKVPRPGEARKGIMGATEEGGREEAVGGENQTV